MFKKKFKISGENQLSGKDKKLLKNGLVKVIQPDAAAHFVDKADRIIAQKVQGSKAIIYVEEDNPMVVDLTGSGDLIPTPYFMQAYPGCLSVCLINEGVEEALFNGANLMWPGVRADSLPEDFQRNTVAAVLSSKRDCVAVGTMACSAKDGKLEGIAVNVACCCNDWLWNHGEKNKLPTRLAFDIKEKGEKES